MAGEIQLNSTTFATESGGTITVTNVDSATNRQNLGLEIGVDVQSYDADTTKNDVANTFTANQIISVTDNTNAALRVTQLGTGNALVVEDSTNPDSSPFVVDSSGNVGIGTSSPAVKLDVAGGVRIAYDTFLEADDNSGGWVEMLKTDSSLNTVLANNKGSAIVFNNNATSERMRIDSSGNVGIGVTSVSYQLQLSTDSAGKPSTNTWTVVSDERIKENIELADLDLCYDAVKNIPLKRFKWRDEVYSEEQVADRHKLGWIAQDVESVYPKAVNIHEFRYNQIYNETIIPATEDEPERTEKELVSEDVIEDCRNLNADQIYAAMYGAIQKLIQNVESQQSQIDALTARIEALETTS